MDDELSLSDSLASQLFEGGLTSDEESDLDCAPDLDNEEILLFDDSDLEELGDLAHDVNFGVLVQSPAKSETVSRPKPSLHRSSFLQDTCPSTSRNLFVGDDLPISGALLQSPDETLPVSSLHEPNVHQEIEPSTSRDLFVSPVIDELLPVVAVPVPPKRSRGRPKNICSSKTPIYSRKRPTPTKKSPRSSQPKQPKKQPSSEDKNYKPYLDSDPDFDTFPYTLLSGYKAPLGPQQPQTPLDFFQLFLTGELIDHIVKETNTYAYEHISMATPLQKRSIWSNWKDLTADEFKAFLGIVINMGLNPKPNLQDYFSQEWHKKQSFFTDVFSRDRFFQIFWCLHVSSKTPAGVRPSRGSKISHLVTYLQAKFCEYFVPPYELSMDESTVSFKGKVHFKQYNPKKP